MQALEKVKKVSESGSFLRVVIGILVFGSVWGLVEATLGGALHLIHFTYKGAITGGIGMSIMAAFVVMYRQPKFWQFSDLKPKAFYASTIAITAFCWIGAAVAFASGL